MSKIFLFLIFPLLMQFTDKTTEYVPAPVPLKSIYVSVSGSDKAEGSAAKPFRTISYAVSKAMPGDKILVSAGVYRESVVFERGGSSTGKRITLQALNRAKVMIKGSDRKTGWVKDKNKLWKCVLDTPQTRMMLFFNSKKLVNVTTLQECSKALRWTKTLEDGKAVIWANFGALDPNVGLTELSVRNIGISAGPGVDYINIEGIAISQIANGYASIYAEQPGAIDTKNGKYWSIIDCSISECHGVGISIGTPGHVYTDVNAGRPEFNDYTDLASVGHHKISKNHIFNCGQAGIFGLIGGTSSIIEDNLIENINQDGGYTGDESAGIRLAMAVDATLTHNLIRRVYGKNGYGVFLGPIFQGARLSRNIISDSNAGLLYLFKNHGPTLFDNNILAMTDTADKKVDGVKMEASEANVFVQNLFYNCSFLNGRQPGMPVSTSNFLPHSLVIKQTIPALNIDHRWYGNLFVGKGAGIAKSTGCEADFNLYADGALPLSWADENSTKAKNSLSFRLEHHQKGVALLWKKEALRPIKIPALTANFLGFFALSKQYIEYPDGKKITINRDFLNMAGTSVRPPGPFYPGQGLKQRIKLF
ncbi:right-handed parallel beta-helix repeat-containing protein [Pedobacter riviphilus]|uniref:Right-handed parallel beta-helix repeat-containing protein n=1 Tax=Pedobacter riviphilus TaxID=2766984 RepID=A0ABX6TI37_9SPHI|nr:right-handed parallel beta-helix repeat-containing protein [Pedobacter riviphilus]QNR85189.1 right-handed parallel beta-helix repeat-containing protein [Pedobacter riviphilus]